MGKKEQETRINWYHWKREKSKIDYPALVASIIASIAFLWTLTTANGLTAGILALFFVIFSRKFFTDKIFRTKVINLYPYLVALAIITLFADTLSTHFGLKIEGTYETNNFLVYLWSIFGYTLGFFIHDLINMILISLYTYGLVKVENKAIKIISLCLLSGSIIISAFGAINNIWIIYSSR